MTDGMPWVSTLRNPEYTGPNRCIPCTVLNIGITGILAVGFGFIEPIVGALVLLGGFVTIWLRGYLIPGTPTLTERYVPDWILVHFDKSPLDPVTDVNPEEVLTDALVLTPCEDEDDVCLADAFADSWHSEITTLRAEGAEQTAIADHLDLDPESVTFESHGDAYAARADGRRIGQWESQAALVADLATVRVLPDWIPAWERFSAEARSQVIGGLRIFLEECPRCGGMIQFDTDVVRSCCRSQEVATASCDACGDRLLEAPIPD